MYHESNYKIKSITEDENGEKFEAVQHVRSGTDKYYRIRGISVPENIELEPGDVVRLKIENHSSESGGSNRSWALEEFIGFPYK